ncbi:YbhB/YbcL family Raf kinase inhibitor-like protein [Streptomyces sp. NPDC002082]|uniref:YbhB/YbcL family Raf kinase inhibitor-like protein n=1 Tax=Streptomyces sp. NPDC002082 TaxID=3154772 RepID=UPI003328D7A6
MKVFSNTFDDHPAPAANRNPHVAWSDVPEGTRSLVLAAVDVGIPAEVDDLNRTGRAVPADMPRQEFNHWVLVDIDPGLGEIAEGALGEDGVPGGKPGPEAAFGAPQGANSYRGFFAGDPAKAGGRSGPDGPCPPRNDGLVHRYVFLLYATDLERVPLGGTFTAADVLEAIDGHVLDETSFTGHYSLDPSLA